MRRLRMASGREAPKFTQVVGCVESSTTHHLRFGGDRGKHIYGRTSHDARVFVRRQKVGLAKADVFPPSPSPVRGEDRPHCEFPKNTRTARAEGEYPLWDIIRHVFGNFPFSHKKSRKSRLLKLMSIYGCHWSYPSSDFGERIDVFRDLLPDDEHVTLFVHERPTKDRQEIS